jgi:sec-independent protein translocase protein TatA
MPNIGPLELILLGVLAVIIFGPAKLPEIGRSIGKGMREFKESVSGVTEIRDTLDAVGEVRSAMSPTNLAGAFVPGVKDVQETVGAARGAVGPAGASAAEPTAAIDTAEGAPATAPPPPSS